MLVLIVEPTVSGLHDMERVADLAAHFKVPGMVCINKYDLNMEMTRKIEAFAAERNMKMVGRIGFDSIFIKAMIQGRNVLEEAPDSSVAGSIKEIWREIITSPVMNRIGIKDFSAVIR